MINVQQYAPTQMARPSFPTPPLCRFQGFPHKQIDFVWEGSVHAAPLGRRETTTAHPPTAFRTSASKIQPGNPYASAIHLSALLLRAIFRQLCISIFFGKDRHITYTSPLGSPAGIGADLYTYINVYHPRAAASPRSNLNHFFMFLQLTWALPSATYDFNVLPTYSLTKNLKRWRPTSGSNKILRIYKVGQQGSNCENKYRRFQPWDSWESLKQQKGATSDVHLYIHHSHVP